MFNDSNVDNRLRYPVRGRVIVFTTSKVVEFLQDDLRYSYPLYSVDTYPQGYGLSFCVELNGFLTFDSDCQVRISPEFTPFSNCYYDPKAFALVKAADPFVFVSTVWRAYAADAPDSQGLNTKVGIDYYVVNGIKNAYFYSDQPMLEADLIKPFVPGAPFSPDTVPPHYSKSPPSL